MEEDRGLNLNQPFLSVRRFSPAVPSAESKDRLRKTDRNHRTLPKVPQPPPYRSELKSGPLRKPGTIPFTWEQSPGRPKYEEVSQHQSHQRPDQRPSITPKLPPGRTPNPKQSESQDQAHRQPSVGPEVPPQVPWKQRQDESSKATDHVGKNIRYQENVPADNLIAKNERPSGGMEMGITSSVEDGDETYFDAPDNLSRSESSFYNCSISGLSGLFEPDLGSRGTFAMDPQLQDFMMGRFLPAAKAMASEMPSHSHAPKKQPLVAREQPQPRVRKASNVNKHHPLYRYNSSFLSHYIRQTSGFESEVGDKVEPETPTVKACGLLPRFLLKSSFCILESEQDVATQKVEKLNLKDKPSRRNGLTHKRDSQNLEVSAEDRHLRGERNLSCKIKMSASRTILQKDKEAKEKEKGCTSFRDLLASEGDEWKSSLGSGGPVIERTLYMDSVQTENSCNSDMSSVSGPPSYRRTDFDVIAVDNEVEEAAHIESLPRDIEEINIIDKREIPGDRAKEQVDSIAVSSQTDGRSIKGEQTSLFDSSHHEIKHIVFVAKKETLGQKSVQPVELKCSEQHNFLNSGTTPEKRISTCHKDENIDIEQQSTVRSSDHQSASCSSHSTFHIPPLLPKSPAESWLFRTLPSISSRYSPARFSPSSQGTDRFRTSSKPHSTNPQREPIIKTTRPSLVSKL